MITIFTPAAIIAPPSPPRCYGERRYDAATLFTAAAVYAFARCFHTMLRGRRRCQMPCLYADAAASRHNACRRYAIFATLRRLDDAFC